MPHQTRCLIYCRLSKDRSGLSENTGIQLQECRDYAADEGWTVVAEFEENDISASKYSTKPRPKYEAAVALVKVNKVDRIIATEQERLHRRPDEMSELINLAQTTSLSHVSFTNDDSFDLRDADGIHRARGAVANAERESNKISKRQRRKKLAQAKAGRPNGGHRPYGYAPDFITPDEVESEILKTMAGMVIRGFSCKNVAYWANEQGHTTTTGKKFYALTVRNMLLKKRYIGIREHLGEEYPATWAPVFDEVTWVQVQAKLSERRRGENYISPSPYLLTGLLLCGRCGNRMTGTTKRDGPSKPMRRIYLCKLQGDTERRSGCTLRCNADALDAFIRDLVLYRLDSDDLGELMQGSGDGQAALTQALARRSEINDRLALLADMLGDGDLTRPEYVRQASKLKDELADIDQEMNALSRSSSAVMLVGQDLRQAWDVGTTDWRREFIKLLIEGIVVNPSSKKPLVDVDGVQMRFDQARIEVKWLY